MWPNFNYSQEDFQKDFNIQDESVNNYKNLFFSYKYNFPSLEDALYQMYKSQNINDTKINELTKDIIIKCNKTIDKNFQEIQKKYKNISKNDARIISSYTCESTEREYSPYRILNKNLVESNRQIGVQNVSKYLYILLKSLRKLPKYPDFYSQHNTLFRSINQKVNLEKGDYKTFWGFTSTSNDEKTTYKFLNNNNNIKSGTLYILYGDIIGYELELFNSYGEKEILLEPERKFIVKSVEKGEIIKVTCEIVSNDLILEEKDNEQNMVIEEKIEENIEKIINIGNSISKFIVKFEKENNKFGIGILCNIPKKHIKALITYNHLIDLKFLNQNDPFKFIINDREIKINLKADRYKYTNSKLNITIIEILKSDNINDFIDVDEVISNENILSICLEEKKELKVNKGMILSINDENNYLCSLDSIKEGIIISNNDSKYSKLIGIIIKNNNKNKEIEFIPMNKIINEINFIKCTYEIRKENLGKEIQLINNKNPDNNISNREIEKKMQIIFNGEIKPVFNREKNINYLSFTSTKVETGTYILYSMNENYLTNMSYMFNNCKCLINIDLSSFNTEEAINMEGLFYDCISLQNINLSSFNTNKVINMSCMFLNCKFLKNIDLSSFNTTQVTKMTKMFYGCNSLKEINVSKFNTNKVENMRGMFHKCCSLKNIIFSNLFKTRNAEVISFMFCECKKLETLDLSSFEAYKLTNISFLFARCTSLKIINLPNFNVNPNCLKSNDNVFYECVSLNQIICQDELIKELFDKELKKKYKK